MGSSLGNSKGGALGAQALGAADVDVDDLVCAARAEIAKAGLRVGTVERASNDDVPLC